MWQPVHHWNTFCLCFLFFSNIYLHTRLLYLFPILSHGSPIKYYQLRLHNEVTKKLKTNQQATALNWLPMRISFQRSIQAWKEWIRTSVLQWIYIEYVRLHVFRKVAFYKVIEARDFSFSICCWNSVYFMMKLNY